MAIDSVLRIVPVPLVLSGLLSLLFCGAIFGFFYAWVCSTMWGLDNLDPAVAIVAMQAMNASVRNAVFFPAFFGSPVILLATALLARSSQRRVSASAFAASAAVYIAGAFLPTMLVNVPMNEALAVIDIVPDSEVAQQTWQAFSGKWQIWNGARTVASGISLTLTGYAIMYLHSEKAG